MATSWTARFIAPALLFAAACTEGGRDPRVAEIWRIDLETHATEVDLALAGLGIPREEIEPRIIAWLDTYFEGLPIFFEMGVQDTGPFRSSVCIRAVDDHALGWGVLDEGNAQADSACGDRGGISFGVFINNIAEIYRVQIENASLPYEVYVDEFARLLTVVIAHEIGHGLGLRHSGSEFGIGDIMRPPSLLRSVNYAFIPDHMVIMRENLERFGTRDADAGR